MQDFYLRLLDLSSLVPLIIVMYVGYLLGRFRAPTLTKYTHSFKVHYQALTKMQRKVTFVRKLRSGLRGAQLVYMTSFVLHYFMRKSSPDEGFSEKLRFVCAEVLSAVAETLTLFTRMPFKTALIHAILVSMNKSFFFVWCISAGFWMAEIARILLHRYQISLERGFSRLRSQHTNMVREFVEDLGHDFSSRLCKHFNDTLTSENVLLKHEMQQLSKKNNDIGSKMQSLTSEVLQYKRIVKKTDDFVWCAECISHVQRDSQLQKELIGQSLSNLFQKESSRPEKQFLEECKSAGTPPDMLDQLSTKEGKDQPQYYPSNSSLRVKRSTNCSSGCVSRFLDMYQKEKKATAYLKPDMMSSINPDGDSAVNSNLGNSGIGSSQTHSPEIDSYSQKQRKSLLEKVQSAIKPRTLPHLLVTSSSVKSTHESGPHLE